MAIGSSSLERDSDEPWRESPGKGSFSIASFVALRAYDVSRREQLLLLRYLLRQLVRSPLKFLFPVERNSTPLSILTAVPEEK